MCLYKKVAVTAAKLSEYTLTEQIKRMAKYDKPDILILREKELTGTEYENLAKKVLLVCKEEGIECVLHSFFEVAENLQVKKIHLTLQALKQNFQSLDWYDTIGASIHSIEEAIEAYRLGATYVTAGHIFETDCKRGLPGKGLEFLKEVCESVPIPVYGIGGITEENTHMVRSAGAAGECRMSYYMKL